MPAASVAGALGGCIGCMVCVESLAKEVPSSMNLMTFSTFLFISLEGLLFTTRFFTVNNKIPFRGHLPVAFTFFLCNVINNQALNFHVPVPLHIIFRSGSLLTSLLMNRALLGRQYPLRKYLSVLAITVGIILCTLATASMEKKADVEAMPSHQVAQHYRELLIGVVMLSAALLISSYLAICQERMYKLYGKHPREAMFYTHALSLPFFALMGQDIWRSATQFTETPAAVLFGGMVLLPISGLWLRLLMNCSLQWLCIMFVYRLNSLLDSLSVTLVVTLRKFLSLLISIYWFSNPFTLTHWLGAALVFGGTLVFADVIKMASASALPPTTTNGKMPTGMMMNGSSNGGCPALKKSLANGGTVANGVVVDESQQRNGQAAMMNGHGHLLRKLVEEQEAEEAENKKDQ